MYGDSWDFIHVWLWNLLNFVVIWSLLESLDAMWGAFLIFFFLELSCGLQSALVTKCWQVGGVQLGSTKIFFLSDWCLDDIVAELLLFEGPVRFYLLRQWFEWRLYGVCTKKQWFRWSGLAKNAVFPASKDEISHPKIILELLSHILFKFCSSVYSS